MKIYHLIFTVILGCIFLNPVKAQDEISYALGVTVFPEEDQSEETQEYDEYQCYKWSKKRTRINPERIADKYRNDDDEPEQPDTGPDGTVSVNRPVLFVVVLMFVFSTEIIKPSMGLPLFSLIALPFKVYSSLLFFRFCLPTVCRFLLSYSL